MQMMNMMAASQAQQGPALKKAKKGSDDGLNIANSCTYLYQLPVIRMRMVIEGIVPEWDTVATGKWETEELMRLIWLLTGMEANMMVALSELATSALAECNLWGRGGGMGTLLGNGSSIFALCRDLESAYLNLRIGRRREGKGALWGNAIGFPIWQGGLLFHELPCKAKGFIYTVPDICTAI